MDKTLISELEYARETEKIEDPSVYSLVVRAIQELKRNKLDIDRLEKQLSNERWKGAICTGSY